MSNLKLEVGKSYRNRNGAVVTLVELTGFDTYPYRDSGGVVYTESGKYSTGNRLPHFDLFEEVASTGPMPNPVVVEVDDTEAGFKFRLKNQVTGECSLWGTFSQVVQLGDDYAATEYYLTHSQALTVVDGKTILNAICVTGSVMESMT